MKHKKLRRNIQLRLNLTSSIIRHPYLSRSTLFICPLNGYTSSYTLTLHQCNILHILVLSSCHLGHPASPNAPITSCNIILWVILIISSANVPHPRGVLTHPCIRVNLSVLLLASVCYVAYFRILGNHSIIELCRLDKVKFKANGQQIQYLAVNY